MSARLSILCAVLAAACSGEAPPSLDGVGAALPEEAPREYHDPWAELYDENGVPRESDQRVAGLVLPRGLTKVDALSVERRHVYTSQMPPHELLRYFGPRLTTVDIERRGEAVIYRDATPRGVQGGVVRLDVTIEPTPRSPTRVEIYERPPPPPEGVVISEDEIRRHFEQRRERAE